MGEGHARRMVMQHSGTISRIAAGVIDHEELSATEIDATMGFRRP